MRQLTIGGALLALGLAAVLLVRAFAGDEGVHEAFPAAEGAGWERLALYIGINKYPAEDVKDLHGCVNDVKRLRAVLRGRYGFARDALLTDEMATQENVGKALRDLLAQTKQAVQNGVKEPLVVIAYAGHGNLVTDQDGDEKEKRKGPQKDSSWVLHDSSARGERDLRDDDLKKVMQAIQKEGATIVLFLDACHSGTSFRGSDDAQVRSVRSGRGAAAATGPQESLFPDLPDAESPRLASFAACQDAQEAWEEERNGVRGGCFTHTLVPLLQRSEAIRSYAEFGRLLADKFASEWPGGKQLPLCVVSSGMEDRLFFGTGIAPPHALITSRDRDNRHVTIAAGSLQGIGTGTRIEFFENLDDLTKRRGLLARGVVESCDAGSAKVKLNQPTALGKDALARLVPSSLPSLRLRVMGTPSDAANATLKPLLADERALFAKEGEPFAFAVVDEPEAERLGVYSPGAWDAEGAKALPVARLPYADALDLVHFAQVRRLLAYQSDEGRLAVELLDADRNPLPRDPATGLVTLTGKTEIYVRVHNRGADPLHIFCWYYEEELAEARRFEAEVLWPAEDADISEDVVRPASHLDSKRFAVTPTWHTKSRMHIRVLATDQSYHGFAGLKRLVRERRIRRAQLAASRAAEGKPDALLDLLEGVASGDGDTRGIGAAERVWATGGAVLEASEG